MTERNKSWLRSLFLATAILFAANFHNASAQTVAIEERLPDGSIVLTIDGVKYRALTADQLRKIYTQGSLLESCTSENSELRQQNETLRTGFDLAKRDAATATEQIGWERKRGDEYKLLFERENVLRLQAEKLPKKQNVFEKILNNPIVQMALVGTAAAVVANQK